MLSVKAQIKSKNFASNFPHFAYVCKHNHNERQRGRLFGKRDWKLVKVYIVAFLTSIQVSFPIVAWQSSQQILTP